MLLASGKMSSKGRRDLLIERAVQFASSLELRSQNFSTFISDSVVRNCNILFWLKNDKIEAWNVCKELGFVFNGEEDVVLGSLQF